MHYVLAGLDRNLSPLVGEAVKESSYLSDKGCNNYRKVSLHDSYDRHIQSQRTIQGTVDEHHQLSDAGGNTT